MASTRTQRIGLVILTGVVIYASIILTFGLIYQKTNSLRYTGDRAVTEYWDCCYFSLVSFQTIGYGDIFPALPIAKQWLFVESILQTIYLSFFSGFLVYYFIKRPNDVFTTKNYFIRKTNNKFFLSIRIGNKGEEIIDCKIIVELLRINDKQIRKRAITLTKTFAIMEKTWYADFELSQEEEHKKLLGLMQKVVKKEEFLQLRLVLLGIDSKSGDPVTLVKYFMPDKLKFGHDYLHVLNWNKMEFTRSKLDWKNFNKIEPPKNEKNLISEFEKL